MKKGSIFLLPFFQNLIPPRCALASIFKSCAVFLWWCVLSIGMSITNRDLQARQRRIRDNDRQVKLKALLQKRKDERRAQLREERRQREAQQREEIRQREAEDEGRRIVDINRQDSIKILGTAEKTLVKQAKKGLHAQAMKVSRLRSL
jgi:hypothetical protein